MVAFCAVVIAGWHGAGSPAVLLLGLERIQYDTAWAFAFAGAALVSFALRLGALTRLFAAVPSRWAACASSRTPSRRPIPIRPMLAVPWLPFGAGNYNDMGVLTALILIALGSALATCGPRDAARCARSSRR